MALILDSSVLIAGERRRETVTQVIKRISASLGDIESAISVVSITDLTHGIYRAKTDLDRLRRTPFVNELVLNLIVHPVSLDIATRAGRIEGELAANGISIDFPDLLIGATALHLGFDVATSNTKHFKLIPGLNVITL